jgi:hypothetical protein
MLDSIWSFFDSYYLPDLTGITCTVMELFYHTIEFNSVGILRVQLVSRTHKTTGIKY